MKSVKLLIETAVALPPVPQPADQFTINDSKLESELIPSVFKEKKTNIIVKTNKIKKLILFIFLFKNKEKIIEIPTIGINHILTKRKYIKGIKE